MEANVITTVLLPIALAVIMLGLGLSLRLDDFRRVLVYPKAVVVGLSCQMLLLPLVCVGIATVFGLAPELAVGLMLLAASPGGPTANLFSHLAKGDVALNITLTAMNSIMSLLTMPLIINLSLTHFMGEGKTIPLQADKVLQVFAVVLIPVAIGMVAHARAPGLTARLTKPVKIMSAAFLLLVIGSAVGKEQANVAAFFRQVGLAALAFNLASMAVGYYVPLVVGLPKRQAVAIGMEIGIHNGTLAIAIASSPLLLNNSMMAIPPAVYSVIMLVTAAAFGFLVSRGGEAPPAASTARDERPAA